MKTHIIEHTVGGGMYSVVILKPFRLIFIKIENTVRYLIRFFLFRFTWERNVPHAKKSSLIAVGVWKGGVHCLLQG